MSTTHSPVGGKQSERSQLTFSWLLGKYTPRAVVSVCIRVTGARPRATCVSAAIRVSLLKEALLSRFYRRTETPVHRPRPIRERERERRETATSETDQSTSERTVGSEVGRTLDPQFFHRKNKKSGLQEGRNSRTKFL